MADFPLYQIIPSGTVGIGAVASTQPWELVTQKDTLTPAQYFTLNDLIQGVNAGGTITNFADAAAGTVCWRLLTGAGTGRALIQFGGTGLGLGGICKILPSAGILSGGVPSTIASQTIPMYMETTVRINATVGGAGEMVFIFSPSYTVVTPNTLAGCNGFGLAWFNSAADDNFRIFVADASAGLLVNVSTGINALTAAIRHIRLEWGWIAGAPRIRAIIDGGTPTDAVGPFALNTANRLGAFASTLSVGVDKLQVDAANSCEALVGHVQGIVVGLMI